MFEGFDAILLARITWRFHRDMEMINSATQDPAHGHGWFEGNHRLLHFIGPVSREDAIASLK